MTEAGRRRARSAGSGAAHARLWLVLLSLVLSSPGWAEQTRYGTWDQCFYKMQLPVKAAAPATEVTLLVYHSYPGPLHDFRITGHSNSLTVTQQPAPRAKLDPTEIVSFRVHVQRTAKAQGETATLALDLQAVELPQSKRLTVTVPLTAKAEAELFTQQSIPVGAMEVRVGGFGNQMYLFYLPPMLGLLGWWWWRRRRLARL